MYRSLFFVLRMLKIGITGGIGSGKTTVCKIFEKIGIPVYYADLQARQLMNTDEVLIHQLKKEFGKDMYTTQGELMRPQLAQIVFNDKQKLEKLNAMVHPAVQRDFKHWAAQQTNTPYVLKEAALLFESGSYKSLDYIVTVAAPKAMRVQRVAKRDGLKKSEVEKRMKNQLSEKDRLNRADFVINNDETQAVIPQIMQLHEVFLNNLQ